MAGSERKDPGAAGNQQRLGSKLIGFGEVVSMFGSKREDLLVCKDLRKKLLPQVRALFGSF